MIDTFADTWGRVILRCPSLSPKLAQDFIRNAFRRLAEHRRWSWKVKFNQFIAPAVYSAGTATVTLGSTTVTGSGTTWTSSMVGRQFRIGTNAPLYTIAQFNSSTSIELDRPWGIDSASSRPYQIYQCFFTVPSDFHQFISLWDPAFNWQLGLNINQNEINMIDAQRSNVGNAYVVSFRDYTTSQIGLVAPALQVLGSGPSPTSSGTYLGPNDTVFTVEITLGGLTGTAQYRWKKGPGNYTSTVLTSAIQSPLQDGVQIAFPIDQTYILGDIWVISAVALSNPGLPRYELWPHQQGAHVYPFLYESVPPDLSEPGIVLPRYVRGDILVELALEDVASWPGPSTDKPNPYFSLGVALKHRTAANFMMGELELRDDEIFEQDLIYQYPSLGWPWATPYGDSAWLQKHAI